jgi:hypothetical protein
MTDTCGCAQHVCSQVATNDDELGFDPLPSMASLPEYVSLSKIYDDGHTRSRSQSDTLEKSLVQERVKLPELNKLSPNKQRGGSCSEAFKGVRVNKEVSSHVVRHGQITPPRVKASISNKAPKVVKRTARNNASRNSHDLRLTISAASVILLSSSFSSKAESITKPSQRIGRTTTRLRNPVRLLNDRERKLSLEKNRIAAANYRVKKQKKENGLQTQSRELVSNNTILKQSVSDMTQHLAGTAMYVAVPCVECRLLCAIAYSGRTRRTKQSR